MTHAQLQVPPRRAGAVRRRGAARAPIADLRRRAARGVLVNGAYQVGLVLIGALKGLVAAAFLTRADYGLWGLLGLAMWTAIGLKQQFGANDKYIQQADEDQEQAFQRAFTVEMIFAAAMVPVVLAVVVGFAVLHHNWTVLAPGLVLLLILPSAVLQFPLWTFYRTMDYRRQRTLQVIDPLGGAVVTVALAVLGAGYWSLVIGLVAGSWAGGIVALRASPYRLAWRYHGVTVKDYVRFSGPLLIAGLSALGTFQVIYLVGGAPLGIAGLGAFTLVGNLVQYTDQADSIVTETLYPAICAARERTAVLAEAFLKSNRLALMWAVPFGTGLTLFASDLVHFAVGGEWSPAIGLLRIMGIVTAVHHVGFNWYAFFKAQGRTWAFAVVAMINAAIVIGAGIPLMYADHLIGIGYAFAFAEAVGLAVRGVLLARFFSGFGILSHLWRAFAPTLPAAAAVLAIRASGHAERSLAGAVAVLSLYVVVTVAATAILERPLLREAVGYLARRRAGEIPAT
ncbi:MAG TPA: oligosaccharide flippase family protein [Solirubrobacteraceae bacterium]|jgi:PST family polysaccharide transporter|nr:oligosaccharide flippase family protein [Solirubrobacteraceae bacterium]